MEIKVIYSSILRQTVQPVTVFDAELKKQADDMVKLMKSHSGIGLAANQVGLDKRLIVLGYHKTNKEDELPEIPFQQLCNPVLVKQSKEKDIVDEGCLSIPGLELPVERSIGVVVEAYDTTGKKVTIKAKGMHARVLQHEIDHINGILFTDHVKNYKKIADYQFARIVFCGSDSFSQPVLYRLLKDKLNVITLITETTKRGGRGQELVKSSLLTYAKENGIAVFQPEDTDELTFILQELKPGLLILASYGKILPAEALTAPIYGCLNVHPSLLPKYRGATPIQSAILNGDGETGVTIMEMSPKVDAGRIISQKAVELSGKETTASLKEDLANIGASELIKVIPVYLSGQAKMVTQLNKEVTQTRKLAKEMGEIDWSLKPTEVDRRVRALNPWPGTFTFLDGKRLKILECELLDDQLALKTVQLEGKNPANWNDFKRGYLNQLTKTDWFSTIR